VSKIEKTNLKVTRLKSQSRCPSTCYYMELYNFATICVVHKIFIREVLKSSNRSRTLSTFFKQLFRYEKKKERYLKLVVSFELKVSLR